MKSTKNKGNDEFNWRKNILLGFKPENRQAFEKYFTIASKERSASENECFKKIRRQHQQVYRWWFLQAFLLASFVLIKFLPIENLSFFSLISEYSHLYVFTVLAVIIAGNAYFYICYHREKIPFSSFQDRDGHTVVMLRGELRFNSPGLGPTEYESGLLCLFDKHRYLYFLNEGVCYDYFEDKPIVIPYDQIDVCGRILRCPYGNIWMYACHDKKGEASVRDAFGAHGVIVQKSTIPQDLSDVSIHIPRFMSAVMILLLFVIAAVLVVQVT